MYISPETTGTTEPVATWQKKTRGKRKEKKKRAGYTARTPDSDGTPLNGAEQLLVVIL